MNAKETTSRASCTMPSMQSCVLHDGS